jgi:hypothetical protein
MPTSITAEFAQQYPIMSLHAMDFKPDILDAMYTQHQLPKNSLYNFFKMAGYVMPVDNVQFSNFEKGWKWDTIHVKYTVTSGGANTAVQITLDDNLDVQNGKSFPVANETVVLPQTHGYVETKITSKVVNANGHVLTITPIRPTDDIQTLTAGTTLIVHSDTHTDGAGTPKGKFNFANKKTFYLTTHKEGLEGDNQALNFQTWYKFMNETGKEIEGVWSEASIDAQMRLEQKLANGFIFGEESDGTNLSLDAATAAELTGFGWEGVGNPYFKTKGVWQHIRDNGSIDYVAAGAESTSDFDTIRQNLLAEGAYTKTIWMGGGDNRIAKINDLLKTQVNYGHAANYITGKVAGSEYKNEGMVAYFDFGEYHQGGMQYVLFTLGEFSNPKGLNADGYGFTNKLIYFPTKLNKDEKTGDFIHNIGIAYLKSRYENRRYKSALIDYFKTMGVDRRGLSLLAEEGLHGSYWNQTGMWTD